MEPDRYLAEAARAMITAASRSQSAVAVLKRHCPHIYHQIRQLRECPSLLALWGRSRNVDENVGQVIVHPAILQAIGQLAEVPLRGRIVHAGLEHTYGYLFSLLETPFGYKRERWTRPDIEDGFGIAAPSLRAEPAEGTLLTNLTWFAGRIAFRDRPRELRVLRRMAPLVSSVVKEYPYAGLGPCRVVEEVTCKQAGGRKRLVRLQTDLVPFLFPSADSAGDSHLLIYSIVSGGVARLVTVFPVGAALVEELTGTEEPEQVVLNGLPYNAYVSGLSGDAIPARRYVVSADDP